MSEALRSCLAVLVAVALVATAGPAVQDARLARSDAAARIAADAVAVAVETLAAGSDPVPLGVDGATRTFRLDLPERSFTAAGPVTLFVGGNASDGSGWDVVGYRVAGQPRHSLPVPVDVRVHDEGVVAPDRRGLVLRGDATVELRLVRVAGRPTVLVRAFK